MKSYQSSNCRFFCDFYSKGGYSIFISAEFPLKMSESMLHDKFNLHKKGRDNLISLAKI